ncbi:copper resistance CopC family protein [Tenggerimyces flavus]|uniref:Copper resistance protein CopC n=1 Tax=Tenggerimyces flavus TaxID=1708749 RepID=A0ABV7YKC6_9ACTN|nr:copper resistance CopC family protein [Tenggerimyces flavus]MBM7787723.1 methionine-rich copper-binding protein CopC [Tenggerimyces flavus]
MRVLQRIVVLIVAGLAMTMGATAPAWAHNELVSTTPEDKANVASAPTAVTLEFNDVVGKRFGFVSVTGPDGKQWNEGAFQVEGSTVTQPLRTLEPAGAYTVAWRVVSADGHPISGTFAFTLTAAGTTSAPPTTAPPTTAPTTEPPSTEPSAAASVGSSAPPSDGSASWPMMAGGLVLGAFVLVGLVVGIPALLRRRRESSVS